MAKIILNGRELEEIKIRIMNETGRKPTTQEINKAKKVVENHMDFLIAREF